jgi:alkanesulfonate monooxygenase SsuD/methylene tetrahydromethanopterin reductase-like flavin-dependent oxidoreductase (luciferase family)
LGLEASNLNPQTRTTGQPSQVFLETLEVLRTAHTEERFAHHGDLFAFPAPEFRADKAHTNQGQ